MNQNFREHITEALAIDEDPASGVWKHKDNINIIYKESEAREFLRELDHIGGWVAPDYETNCLKPEYPESKIVSFGVSNGTLTGAFPWFGDIPKMVSEFLRSNRTRKIASNMKMEQRWTRKFLGHWINRMDWDTVVAAHVIDNRKHIASLKFQAFVQMGISSYNEKVEPYLSSGKDSHYNRIDEIELGTLLKYNGGDCVFAWWLARAQRIALGFLKVREATGRGSGG